ncbi:MAG: serine--tRNA ligase [Alphaproteobacteria bacterium]
MHDIAWIRQNPDAFDKGLARRGLAPHSAQVLEKDKALRQALTDLQDIQQRANAANAAIGAAKGRGQDAGDEIKTAAGLKTQRQEGEATTRKLEEALREVLGSIPNIPGADVPDGADESANVLLHMKGEKPEFGFEPREHFDLGEALGLMDFETAAKLSGARFVVLTGALARLERALASFMLDLHTDTHGYTQVSPPLLVREAAMFGTGQLPKFRDDQFQTNDGLWLIPTAEVPMTNLVREAICDEADLPKRFTAHTPCFRLEAGAAGKDTRGMIRQHQFDKVEMVSITTPQSSSDEHERMLAAAEEVLKRLGLHYRVVCLATGDLGFSAHKTYDIEVWLPGQAAYREISSCSLCGDFQARRMQARYRPANAKGTAHVHTLNGSGVAVGRALIAVMENYQQGDGAIKIPDILVPYMGGLETIHPPRQEKA